MTTLKNFCSDDFITAIEAMICGIQRHESIPNFRLNLNGGTTWEDDVCFGSVAMLTLLELYGLGCIPPEFRDDANRAAYFGSTKQELLKFETAIVLFSRGFPAAFAEYYGLPSPEVAGLGWKLKNHNWQSELPKVIEFWESLSGQKFQRELLSFEERWKKATGQQAVSLQIRQNHE